MQKENFFGGTCGNGKAASSTSAASAEEMVVQIPMAQRGHASTAQIDRVGGAVIYHQYAHDGKLWENGITIVDPARESQPAGDAKWEDLERWSRNA